MDFSFLVKEIQKSVKRLEIIFLKSLFSYLIMNFN